MDEIQRLIAESEIERVIVGIMHAVDRREWDLLPDFFHPGAKDDHGPCKGPFENWCAWVAQRHESITVSMHCLSNFSVRFADDDHARAETYGTVYQVIAPGSADPLAGPDADADCGTRLTLGCRYIDDMERRDGTSWRIANRVVVFEWMRTEPDDGDEIDPGWTRGRRDRTDAWYAPSAL